MRVARNVPTLKNGSIFLKYIDNIPVPVDKRCRNRYFRKIMRYLSRWCECWVCEARVHGRRVCSDQYCVVYQTQYILPLSTTTIIFTYHSDAFWCHVTYDDSLFIVIAAQTIKGDGHFCIWGPSSFTSSTTMEHYCEGHTVDDSCSRPVGCGKFAISYFW